MAKVARQPLGRPVQSVALRLICERETEIENFLPREYWSINTLLASQTAFRSRPG